MSAIQSIADSLQGYDAQSLPVPVAVEFLARLARLAPARAPERLPVPQALDRILAEDIISPVSVPPHDNSAMDGYAFDGRHLRPAEALTRTVEGTALAGRAWQGRVSPEGCLKIMTGAVMPEGLDTVVPQELVTVEGAQIHIPADIVRPGDNRRLAGEDLQAGAPALRQGQRLAPAALGLVASLGLPEVAVMPRLRVAYFSTGSEILSLGEAPREGAVYDSNRYTVMGMLQRLGCEVVDLGVCPDDPAQLKARFAQAAAMADAVITSGGVSVGEADFTKTMMRELGDVAFWRIAMRPGRPMAAGRIGQALLFGLPGNPVAVMVTFMALVRPTLLAMMGARGEPPVCLQARCLEPLRKKPGRTEYQRGVVVRQANGELGVRTTGNQGSGVLRSMVEGNGLIVLHHGQGHVAAGDWVDVLVFDGVI